MKIEDFETIEILAQMDLIRYIVKEDELVLYVVGDNEEEEEEEPHPGEGEFGDELVEHHHDADDGMNGHLFKVIFHGVKKPVIEGLESDSYHTLKADIEQNHIHLEYEGINFDGPNGELTIDFGFDSYKAYDEGKIEGPDV